MLEVRLQSLVGENRVIQCYIQFCFTYSWRYRILHPKLGAPILDLCDASYLIVSWLLPALAR